MEAPKNLKEVLERGDNAKENECIICGVIWDKTPDTYIFHSKGCICTEKCHDVFEKIFDAETKE
jgi:hypothetical protein